MNSIWKWTSSRRAADPPREERRIDDSACWLITREHSNLSIIRSDTDLPCGSDTDRHLFVVAPDRQRAGGVAPRQKLDAGARNETVRLQEVEELRFLVLDPLDAER
jgi:hypothetical protein